MYFDFGALSPRVTKGAPKKKKRERKEREREREKERDGNHKDRMVNQHDDERGAIQVQAGAPEKKTSGVPNGRGKGIRATFFNFAPGRKNL